MIKHHCWNGMQGEEPTARLVYTFVDEVGRIVSRRHRDALIGRGDKLSTIFDFALACCFQCFRGKFTLKWIVLLSIRHRARVKPNVNQIALTLHGFAILVDQNDIIYVWAMQVYLIIIFFWIVAWNKAIVFQRIALHDSCSHTLLYLSIEFFYASYALLIAFIVSPDRKRSSPETWTWEVPVIQILQPIAETPCSCAFRLPANGFIEFYHTLFLCRVFDKPAIERII